VYNAYRKWKCLWFSLCSVANGCKTAFKQIRVDVSATSTAVICTRNNFNSCLINQVQGQPILSRLYHVKQFNLRPRNYNENRSHHFSFYKKMFRSKYSWLTMHLCVWKNTYRHLKCECFHKNTVATLHNEELPWQYSGPLWHFHFI
jgi:hypothetical protein